MPGSRARGLPLFQGRATARLRKESILAVTLDSDIFAATRDGLPDFRTFDSKGQEVPYLIEKVTESCTQTVHETSASEVVSLHERDISVEVVVGLAAIRSRPTG